MTVGDLIRNEIFSRVADEDPDEIERIDQDDWQPFYKKFDKDGKNIFDKYFFPFGLIGNANLKKSDLYGHLRKQWTEIDDPGQIILRLSEYQNDFLDMQNGTNLRGHPPDIARGFTGCGAWGRLHQRSRFLCSFPIRQQRESYHQVTA
jgi:hypothetical protein